MRSAALSVFVVGLSMGVAAGAANAQFLTFGFTDLDGSFNSASNVFTARAVDLAPLHSGGDVSLIDFPGGTADYDAGFLGLGTSADAVFSMSITSNRGTTAVGHGPATITDADGDYIFGIIAGTWTDGGNGFAFFDGSLIRTRVYDNGVQDGLFNGPSGGSFPLAGLTDQHWYGAISFLMPITNGFFEGDFDQNVTLVDGILAVPAPAGIALLAVGGVAMRRRR